MVDVYLIDITQKYLKYIFMYRENNKKWNKISIFRTKEKVCINIWMYQNEGIYLLKNDL
jgi:hypothetical protein